MPEIKENMPEGEKQQRALEEELEHLEEETERRGLLAKIGRIFRRLFSPPKDTEKRS